MERYPANHCGLITALQSSAEDQTVVLRGPVDTMAQWRDQLRSGYRPWLNVYCLPYDIEGATPDYLPGLVSTATRSVVTAFVFSDWPPPQPIGDLAQLEQTLGIA